MSKLRQWFLRHQIKVWLFTVVALVTVTATGLAPQQPRQWEYHVVWFHVAPDDDFDQVQATFTTQMNEWADQGWQFQGRCAHVDSRTGWTDFLVLARPKAARR